MCSVYRAANSMAAIGLSLAFTCHALAVDDREVTARLANLGVDCKYNGDGNVIAVDFGVPSLATDKELLLLKRLTQVVDVTISEMKLGNEGFKHLEALTKLKRLNASKTKCTDKDMEYLAGLMALEELSLYDTAITDASIAILTKLPNLRVIDLSSTRVSSEGIRRLRGELPQLHVIETWEYMAGFVGGRAVLDLDRAVIVFEDIHAPKSSSGFAGGSIEVSKPLDENDEITVSSSFGGIFGAIGSLFATNTSAIDYGSFSASVARKDGIPTICVDKHKIEIKGEGTELFVDGQPFRLGREKLRVIVKENAVPALDN